MRSNGQPTYILGLSAFYHDAAACLLRNGHIVAAAEEERFSRQKHDSSFPNRAVEYCLEEAGITPEQLDHVTFYDQPRLKFDRLIKTYLAYAPDGLESFLAAMPGWLTRKLWMGRLIKREVGYGGKIVYPEHHESHAASAYFPSPFERAAILTIDGVGEWATASWGVGSGNRIDVQHELHFPHSLGLLYTAFTYYTGFRPNSGEYKVMGLAPYGRPEYKDLILDELMDLREDGSFRLDMKYFNYCQGLTMTSEAFHDLFGAPPRDPESELTQREMDLARSVQEVTEEVVLRMARHIRTETGETQLCMAGGVALNCVANGKILQEGVFDDIWIQPAAGDAGGALGAAYYVWHQVLDRPREITPGRDSQQGSYLGPGFSPETCADWLDSEEVSYHQHDREEIPDLAAELIEQGKVIGLFQGRMEFGPRALGNRSILGDPRDRDMQSRINRKIKFRESFRPFAPTCLREDVSEYFELDRASPYMLLVAPVRPERCYDVASEEERLSGIDKLQVPRSDIPAVTHVDYSARVQTVDREDNPLYYEIIDAFKRRTGYGVVINTSFNIRGEPIVCTPKEAYQCFMHTDMDVLIMENMILYKEEQHVPEKESEEWREMFELD